MIDSFIHRKLTLCKNKLQTTRRSHSTMHEKDHCWLTIIGVQRDIDTRWERGRFCLGEIHTPNFDHAELLTINSFRGVPHIPRVVRVWRIWKHTNILQGDKIWVWWVGWMKKSCKQARNFWNGGSKNHILKMTELSALIVFSDFSSLVAFQWSQMCEVFVVFWILFFVSKLLGRGQKQNFFLQQLVSESRARRPSTNADSAGKSIVNIFSLDYVRDSS